MKSETGLPPSIGVFKNDQPLYLMPFPNGGWTITQPTDPMCHPRDLGAYSNSQDMLEALRNALA